MPQFLPYQKPANQDLREAIGFLNGLKQWGCGTGLFNDQGGNLWNVTTSGGTAIGGFRAAYLWLATQWFNMMQRYMARYAYISNGYTINAVDNLAILVLGEGFEYQCDSQAQQDRINGWIKDNNWIDRSLDNYKQYLIDGEIFYRVFKDAVVEVDPDLVYGDDSTKPGQWGYNGVITNAKNYRKVEGYLVNQFPSGNAGTPEKVPVSDIQHRKNALFGLPRGFSYILPVAMDMFSADELTTVLAATANVPAKIAAIRSHDSPADAVRNFRTNIQSQPQNTQNTLYVGQTGYGNPGVGPQNMENYPTGSIIDTDLGTKWEFPDAPDCAGHIEVLKASLRKIGSHFHLPMAIFSQDQGERGAYAAELATGGYLNRMIKSLQSRWKRQDVEIMEMAGLDMTGVIVSAPEVAMFDKDSEVKTSEFLFNIGVWDGDDVAKHFSTTNKNAVDNRSRNPQRPASAEEPDPGKDEGETEERPKLDPAKQD